MSNWAKILEFWCREKEEGGPEGRNELPARVYRLGKGWEWFCLHKWEHVDWREAGAAEAISGRSPSSSVRKSIVLQDGWEKKDGSGIRRLPPPLNFEATCLMLLCLHFDIKTKLTLLVQLWRKLRTYKWGHKQNTETRTAEGNSWNVVSGKRFRTSPSDWNLSFGGRGGGEEVSVLAHQTETWVSEEEKEKTLPYFSIRLKLEFRRARRRRMRSFRTSPPDWNLSFGGRGGGEVSVLLHQTETWVSEDEEEKFSYFSIRLKLEFRRARRRRRRSFRTSPSDWNLSFGGREVSVLLHQTETWVSEDEEEKFSYLSIRLKLEFRRTRRRRRIFRTSPSDWNLSFGGRGGKGEVFVLLHQTETWVSEEEEEKEKKKKKKKKKLMKMK